MIKKKKTEEVYVVVEVKTKAGWNTVYDVRGVANRNKLIKAIENKMKSYQKYGYKD